MSQIAQDQDITYQAFNTSTQQFVSGDQANHTLKVISGITESTLAVTITPLSNGRYGVTVPGSMITSRFMTLTGVSSTPSVMIVPQEWEAEIGDSDTGALVDNDYGGTDALRVVSNGVGVGAVTVTAYLASDWDAGIRLPQDSSTTGPDGRWGPMRLADGSYVLLFERQGVIQSNTSRITVPMA